MTSSITIDYLTFSARGMAWDEAIETILEMNKEIFEPTRGINFYNSGKVYNNIRVLYDGEHTGNTVCVNISGQGCRVYEENGERDILVLLSRIAKNPSVNVTRLDIACDDQGGILDIEKAWEATNNGNYRTRSVSVNCHESRRKKGAGAKTIYFGSPASYCRVRIYDKAKQTYDPQLEPEMYNDFHWIRFEMVLRDTYAAQAALLLADSEDIGATVAGIINDKFAFVNHDDSNVSRCSLIDWWADFLGEIQGIKLLSKQKANHSIEQHRDWLDYSCARVIAKVVKAIGHDGFGEILEHGTDKLTDSDLAQINDYKRRKGGVE
jgi:phage replication initiation protein